MMLVDFKEDFKNQIAFELKTFGSCYDESLDVATNFFILLKTKRRIPDAQPREIYIAKMFSIPEEHQKGFNILVEKILRGDDLRPYLSRKLVKGIGKLSFDKALDDFGVIHFHLGEYPDNGTKKIAFALTTKEAVYFIDILDHGSGHSDVWFNTHFVQIIHDNWSELIAHRRFNIDSVDKHIPTEEQRKILRRKGCTVPITVSDGTQYVSAGIGFASNSFNSSIKQGGYVTMIDFIMNRTMKDHLEHYDLLVRQEEGYIRTLLGLTKDEPFILKMSFHENNFKIFEPTKNITIINNRLGWLCGSNGADWLAA